MLHGTAAVLDGISRRTIPLLSPCAVGTFAKSVVATTAQITKESRPMVPV